MAGVRTCEIVFTDGTVCGRPRLAHDICGMHLYRERKGLDPTTPPGGRAKTVGPCSIEACSFAVYSKGLCSAHYQRLVDGKQVDAPIFHRSLPFTDRVRLRLSYAKPNADGCLIDARISKATGYATIMKDDDDSSSIAAHRAVYKVVKGPIPKWAQVHHACGNRTCINPDHLVLASQKDNTAEMHARNEYERRIAHLEAQLAEHHCSGCTCTA